MKAVIVQGAGFYGVNIRLVSDEVGDAVARKIEEAGLDKTWAYMVSRGLADEAGAHEMENGSISVVPVEDGKSFGFDSGMWDVGEMLIDHLTGAKSAHKDRHHIGHDGNFYITDELGYVIVASKRPVFDPETGARRPTDGVWVRMADSEKKDPNRCESAPEGWAGYAVLSPETLEALSKWVRE